MNPTTLILQSFGLDSTAISNVEYFVPHSLLFGYFVNYYRHNGEKACLICSSSDGEASWHHKSQWAVKPKRRFIVGNTWGS